MFASEPWHRHRLLDPRVPATLLGFFVAVAGGLALFLLLGPDYPSMIGSAHTIGVILFAFAFFALLAAMGSWTRRRACRCLSMGVALPYALFFGWIAFIDSSPDVTLSPATLLLAWALALPPIVATVLLFMGINAELPPVHGRGGRL